MPRTRGGALALALALAGLLIGRAGDASAASAASAAVPRFGVSVRAGAAQPGMQGTIREGVLLGVAVEALPASPIALGLGYEWAHEEGRVPFDELENTIQSVEAHVRTTFANGRVRPWVEVGFGYHGLARRARYGTDLYTSTTGGAGAVFRGGAQLGLSERIFLRPGVAYHLIVESPGFEGGNAEDYVGLELALAYGLGGR